jgi:D-alanyl-lipoteichoic acid acyltransferase DltB (MBOAT superfamily)
MTDLARTTSAPGAAPAAGYSPAFDRPRPRDRAIALLVIAVGVAMLGVALGADLLGAGRQAGFGVRQLALAVVGLAVSTWGTDLLTTEGVGTLRAPRQALASLSLASLARWGVIVAEVGVLVVAIGALRIENPAFATVVVPLAGLGFIANHLLPARRRLAFFSALSMLGAVAVFGLADGAWLLAAGLALIALCHVPVPFGARVALVLAAGVGLALMRAGVAAAPWGMGVWPILGSMFMFRLVVYLYDLKHAKAPMGAARTLGYFFMLPNLTFPLFPVVDFATFRRTYYDRDELAIYQEGVRWMVRGVVHLLLYRLVYQYMVIAPAEVHGTLDLARYMVANFLLYLRVSGSFHLIVGMLHLFGFRLPETHRFFYLASSFSDFWRRINIYWKDFMMKVVYYPVHFRLRKVVRSETAVIAIATLGVFFATWLLHAYQWFWLLGTVLHSWTDVAFWSILAVLLVANAILEQRRGRTRRIGAQASQWSAREIAVQVVKVMAVFIFMTALWSLWTSHTFGDWFALVRGAELRPRELLMVLGALFTVVTVATVALRTKLGAAGTPPAQFRLDARTLATVAPVALVWAAVQPAVVQRLPFGAQEVVHTVRVGELNKRDAKLLQQGYYENLIGRNGFSSQLWELQAQRPKDWPFLWQTPIAKWNDSTFMRVELQPNVQVVFHGALLTTNRWGMRDRDYTQALPPDTRRIALLGPSYVMGEGVRDDDTFEAIVERRLASARRAGEPQVQLLNFGISGLHPTQHLVILRDRAAAFHPEVAVLVAHPENEWEASDHLAFAARDGIDPPDEFMRDIVRRAGIVAGMPNEEVLARMRPFREELLAKTYRAFADEARARGIRPIWLLLPLPERIAADEELPRLRAVAAAAGFDRVWDLSHVYDGEELDALRIAPWDRHPNARGQQLIADGFERLLRAEGLAGRAPRR